MRGKKQIELGRFFLMGILALYVALSLLLLIFDWNLISNYQKKRQEAIKNEVEDTLGELENSLDGLKNRMYEIWMYDEDFEEVSKSGYNSGQYNQAVAALCEKMKNIMATDENLHGYYLYYPSDEECRYGSNQEDIVPGETEELSRILKNYLAENTQSNALENQAWTTVTVQGKAVFAVGYRKEQSVLFGVYSLEKVREELKSKLQEANPLAFFGMEGSFLGGDEAGREIYREIQYEQSGTYYSQHGIKEDIYSYQILNTDVRMYTVIPKSIWNYMNIWQMLLILLELCSVGVFWKFIKVIRGEVVTPLNELVEKMNGIRRGETKEITERRYSVKELQEVNDTFDTMIVEVREQKNRAYEELLEKQRAQLQYLRLQVKPHFYLNGLKVLNALSVNGENEKLREMILELSGHLRYLLSSDRDKVTVNEELAFCRNYIKIQEKMTGRQIEWLEEIQPEALEQEVPILCIHTFVENSVKYAHLKNSWDRLSITVSAAILDTDAGRFINLVIRDNGEGYPKPLLDRLQSGNGEPDTHEGEGSNIGITNIRERCRILCGEEAQISLYNQDGAVSDLILPIG